MVNYLLFKLSSAKHANDTDSFSLKFVLKPCLFLVFHVEHIAFAYDWFINKVRVKFKSKWHVVFVCNCAYCAFHSTFGVICYYISILHYWFTLFDENCWLLPTVDEINSRVGFSVCFTQKNWPIASVHVRWKKNKSVNQWSVWWAIVHFVTLKAISKCKYCQHRNYGTMWYEKTRVKNTNKKWNIV